jgi:UDP-4-amino-4,6-dideoxy-N-acetyl-beta-L-altrosamine N-acetyltransferase
MKKINQKVKLRALSHSDLDRVLIWHNDPELYASLGGHFRFVSREAETEWFDGITQAKDQINLAICLSEANAHIGNIYLRNIDWISRNCELHAFIADPKHRGKGYGSAAVLQIMKYAFEDLGLVRIYLQVLANNSAAIAMYEKCGFVTEGRLKRHALKAGAFEDVLAMGICRE